MELPERVRGAVRAVGRLCAVPGNRAALTVREVHLGTQAKYQDLRPVPLKL